MAEGEGEGIRFQGSGFSGATGGTGEMGSKTVGSGSLSGRGGTAGTGVLPGNSGRSGRGAEAEAGGWDGGAAGASGKSQGKADEPWRKTTGHRSADAEGAALHAGRDDWQPDLCGRMV